MLVPHPSISLAIFFRFCVPCLRGMFLKQNGFMQNVVYYLRLGLRLDYALSGQAFSRGRISSMSTVQIHQFSA